MSSSFLPSSSNGNQEVGALVDKITTSGLKDLDQESWDKLKLICKQEGDSVVEQIFHMLIFQLSRNHSQIRYCTLLLMDELFRRSHSFRTLLLRHDHLNSFIELTLGVNEEKPLPAPKAWAKDLKKKAVECIDFWHDKFKQGYPSLKSLYQHFSTTCINFRQREIVRQNERAALEAERQRELETLKKKMDKVNQQFDEIKSSCEAHLTKIFNCFQLLYPDIQKEDIFNEDDLSEISSHLTIGRSDVPVTVKPYIEIVKTCDNEGIIQNLKDIYHDIVSHGLPKIKLILKEMAEGPEFCKDEIKLAIDLKSQLLIALQKFIELKIIDKPTENDDDKSRLEDTKVNSMDKSVEKDANNSTLEDEDTEKEEEQDSEEDDEFEEVQEKEGLESIIPQHRRKEYGLNSESTFDPNQPSSSRSSTGTMCKVALPNGKLCPRRDARKCPFHGPIIPRDEMGEPLNESDRERLKKKNQQSEGDEIPDWQDPEYLKDLEAQIGIDLTVRKDKKGSKKKIKLKALEDIRTCDETPRKRLKRKIFNKDAQERLARDLDYLDERRSLQYEDQWNYALNS